MVMDQGVTGYFDSMKGLDMNELIKALPDQNLLYGINSHSNAFPVAPDSRNSGYETKMGFQAGVECQEDCDFSDIVLKYISQILMEENLEEKKYLEEQESAALLAAEKSLYEAIGKTHPTALEHVLTQTADTNVGESSNSNTTSGVFDYSSCSSGSPVEPLEQILNFEVAECQHLSSTSVSSSQSSFNSYSSTGYVGNRLAVSPINTLVEHHMLDEQSTRRFAKGLMGTNKSFPTEDHSFSSCLYSEWLLKSSKDVMIKDEEKNEHGYSAHGRKSRKSSHPKDNFMDEERNNKMSATYNETVLRTEMFDMVLLNCGTEAAERESALREALLNEANKNGQQNVQAKGAKGRGKKSKSKRELVDLRTLLTLCAQAVAANDQRGSMELLKQIRQHSSETGDGMQRMAHYFANGLEARLAGSGTPFYRTMLHRNRSAADVLKAYHMYLAISPFRKMSNFFANKTIMQVAENKTKLHIIDFGIQFGFQWPCLIQRLSARPGGPPKIHITGIDFPQPGFRPADKVDETGRRLANYAESFDVPFEYNGIAKEWETITTDDLKLRDDEVLVVNCLFNMRNVLDESVKVDSPRNAVMKLIRKTNPTIFIHGVVNGTYNAPFFISRFRESVFHYSSLYDMLETNIPRDIPERLLIEKEIFGRELMNVVACEGSERTERPETCKQWQVRTLRAGFVPLPLNEEIMRLAKERVKSCYHKDFMIGEDGNWLIQGWKGRIAYGLSSWRPAN
uniref:Scarecrow-like protein 9 n=1 Tax=Kalanchoe fedtschenkoi TaxID=63787 RepID=A0A7N0UU46_KALFE